MRWTQHVYTYRILLGNLIYPKLSSLIIYSFSSPRDNQMQFGHLRKAEWEAMGCMIYADVAKIIKKQSKTGTLQHRPYLIES